MLKFSHKLTFDINQPSQSNGWTALDWINTADNKNAPDKKEIVNILKRYGALTKDDLPQSSLMESNK